MLPFPGDCHILKNYALALMKIYGPAGLNDLLALLHKGRTEKCVATCTDFEKTFAFFIQSWEAMYRIQIELFLASKDKASADSALSYFSRETFMADIAKGMEKWGEINQNKDIYLDTFSAILNTLEGCYDEFQTFVEKMSTKNLSFCFWNKFIHQDCMAYLCLYLAGRSANWDLRVYSIKQMLPLFHVVNSTFYYRLLPEHLHDLLQFPPHILGFLQAGGFTMSQTGKQWSSIFLDETHETNREVKEVVSSLSLLSLQANYIISHTEHSYTNNL